jgi:hypothetical protein
MLKKFLAAFICLTLILTPTVLTTKAEAVGIGISPLWTYANSITLNMSYSNGTVNWSGSITGSSSCDSISVQYKLYKKNQYGNYVLVYTSPTKSSDSRVLTSSGSYSGASGDYKLYVSGTVTSTSNNTESISKELEKTLS